MSVWIRSSKKKNLIKCESLSILDGKDVYSNDKKCYEYDKYTICEMWEHGVTPLGTYKTEERAIEVLDEIQEHIDNGYAETFVMPED